MAKKKYTARERNAYHAGRGYRAGYEGKAIPYKNPQTLAAFRAGYRAAAKAVASYADAKARSK